MAGPGYSFLLKSRMMNNCLLADTGPTTPVTAYRRGRPVAVVKVPLNPAHVTLVKLLSTTLVVLSSLEGYD